MSDPTFGISITRIDNEPRPAVWSDMSVVGLIGTAPAADATAFPADTPVFMYSDDVAKRHALGTTGTIPGYHVAEVAGTVAYQGHGVACKRGNHHLSFFSVW